MRLKVRPGDQEIRTTQTPRPLPGHHVIVSLQNFMRSLRFCGSSLSKRSQFDYPHFGELLEKEETDLRLT